MLYKIKCHKYRGDKIGAFTIKLNWRRQLLTEVKSSTTEIVSQKEKVIERIEIQFNWVEMSWGELSAEYCTNAANLKYMKDKAKQRKAKRNIETPQ